MRGWDGSPRSREDLQRDETPGRAETQLDIMRGACDSQIGLEARNQESRYSQCALDYGGRT